jgi:hypothetical protein
MTSMVENAIEIEGNNTFDADFDKAYNVSEFTYNKEQDSYTCPAGQTLKEKWKLVQQKSLQSTTIQNQNCKNCAVKDACTKAKYQRIIERHKFDEALEINKITVPRTLKYIHKDKLL